MSGRKDGKCLYNDALNTFYLRLYGVGHMVKDHSDSEKETRCHHMGYSFQLTSKGSFICTIPQTGITHTTAFVTPVVVHWLEREIAQWVHPMKDRSDDSSHHERTPLPRSYISLQHPTDSIVHTLVLVIPDENPNRGLNQTSKYRNK